MKRKNPMKNLFAIAGVLLMTSCATIVRKEFKQDVTFNANGEQNVDVYVDGDYKGQAPQTVTLDAREAYKVKYAKEGMEPNEYNMRGNVQGKYVLGDIVMGGVVLGWIPLIVDGVTDKWRDFDNATIDYRYKNFDWKAGSYNGPGEQSGNGNSDNLAGGGDLNDPNGDYDGDGIMNMDDFCPTVSGTKANKGCATAADLEAGRNDATNAFGDVDGDGVINRDDSCPVIKGTSNFNGCPNEEVLFQANSKWGTADLDNDGIINKNDVCSNLAGVLKYKGCPTEAKMIAAEEALLISSDPSLDAKADTDGDGILNKDDYCPTVAGSKKFNGCVDQDGLDVGMNDPKNKWGDIDKDGILNKDDECIIRKGTAEFQGCPNKEALNMTKTKWATGDVDGDGIMNINDACSSEAGILKFKGCPTAEALAKVEADLNGDLGGDVIDVQMDTDKDGVPDVIDDCPEVAGLAELKGCPANGSGQLGDDVKDSDGDGVADNIDDCPTIKGLPELKGCPKIEDDSHGADGKIIPKLGDHGQIMNWRDIHEEDLPDVSGKMFEIKNLNFETGSAKIKSSSYTELNDVVEFMKKVPSAKFDVEGHTDSQGSDSGNLSLSQKRAKSVVAYLVSKGISQSRLEDHGYGEAKPVATNETAEGRATNRRVEFHFK